jgi:hypothetical protein
LSTLESVRLFSDGRMSLHDIRALLESIGHNRIDFAAAVITLLDEGATLRVGSYQRDELHAELYLTAVQN